MPNTGEIFENWKHLFNNVPAEGQEYVCYLCLGAVSDYQQCFDCRELFMASNCPRDLRQHVIPMTVAENPSPWYGILKKYKAGQFQEYGVVVASVAYQWLKRHHRRIAGLLGGDADFVTIVPSKRRVTYAAQPLRHALALVPKFGNRLNELLRCEDATLYGRSKYAPEMFAPLDPRGLRGRRIILIEDTWITGATAVSAAGAMYEAGAESVVITPIAREMKPSFHGEEHPYRTLIAGE